MKPDIVLYGDDMAPGTGVRPEFKENIRKNVVVFILSVVCIPDHA